MAPPPAIPPQAPEKPSVLARLSLPGRIGLSVGFMLMLGFGYWLMFDTDMTGKIKGAQNQQQQLKTDLANKQQAQANYIADVADLEMRRQRAPGFNRVLPADKQQPAFLSSVQLAANTSGIDLKVYTPMEEQVQPFYVKDPMRLELTGRFHQVLKFIHEVGKLDRVINVENIELIEPKMVGDEIIIKGRCLVTAFHALPPKKGPQKK